MYRTPVQVAMIIMGFSIIVVGLVLYVRRFGKDESNKIKIFTWEFTLSNSAILIFLVGAALVIVGYLYLPGEMHGAEQEKDSTINVPPVPVDYRQFCSKPLQKSDLEGKSQTDLTIIRNTIYAMHGYIFHTNPALIDYFNKFSWYRPRGNFNENADLSQMDKDNVNLILGFETDNPH